MNREKRKLEYGEVTKIACRDMNIRIYDTKDAIDDRVIILDKAAYAGYLRGWNTPSRNWAAASVRYWTPLRNGVPDTRHTWPKGPIIHPTVKSHRVEEAGN